MSYMLEKFASSVFGRACSLSEISVFASEMIHCLAHRPEACGQIRVRKGANSAETGGFLYLIR